MNTSGSHTSSGSIRPHLLYLLFQSSILLCQAQTGWCGVATDGTLQGTTATVLTGPNYSITANLGRQSGSNLFHSFDKFSLSAGDKAIFSGPAGITSIISRVTGEASSIDGTLSSTISGADLYLINPRGIAFGPNASLDLTGSFYASTADQVKLGTAGGLFPADPATTLNLTTDPPAAFGFLNPPKAVTVNGSFLSVPQGKTLSLTSGDISITDSNLWSYGGTVSLVSLASPGEVNIGTYASTAPTMGTVRISDTRGLSGGPVYATPGMEGYKVANVDASGAGGGRIFIRGGALYMNSAYVFNDTYGDVPGGITDIQLFGKAEIVSSTITGAGVSGSASGAATSLTAGSDILIRDSNIGTDTWNGVNGSALSIKSSGNLTIEGVCGISANADGGGKAGSVSINAAGISLAEGSGISSSSEVSTNGSGGGAGSITIQASQSLLLEGNISSQNKDGASGNITITSPDVTIARSGLVSSSMLGNPSTQAQRSGDIIINSRNLSLLGSGRIEARVFYSNNGSSGDIKIKTDTLSLTGGGAISSSIDSITGTGGSIIVDASGSISVSSIPSNQFKEKGSIASDSTSGNAGHIILSTPQVSITGGGSLTTIARGGSGTGGDVTVTASDRITIDGGIWSSGTPRRSTISTDTLGGGNAGNITLSAPVITASGGSLVSSVAGAGSSGSGGNISIKAGNTLTVQGTGGGNSSQISVETGGLGNAGTIGVEGASISLADGGSISAAALAVSKGNGGLITVTAADHLTLSGTTKAAGITGNTASSGDGARIRITSPTTEVQSGGYITAETGTGSSGSGGDITIAGGTSLISGGTVSSATRGSGNAGTIKIDGTSLSVSNGGVVSTASEAGAAGRAGNIDITVSGALTVQGTSPVDRPSQITSSTSGSGDGGRVTITSASLDVSAGGVISTSAEAGSSGNGGNIAINAADSLSISGASAHVSSDTSGSGSGGRISAVTGRFQLSDKGSLRTRSSGVGNAGDIVVTADTLAMVTGGVLDSSSGVTGGTAALKTVNAASGASPGSAGNITVSVAKDARISGSMLTTQSATSEGGNITFTTPATVTIDHGELSASATAGVGNGGNVSLNGGTVILHSGKVTAQAERGNGGNLDIRAGLLIASTDSLISASSRFGAQGTVFVDAPAVDIGEALANNLGDFITIDAFLPKRCVMPGDESESTLTISAGKQLPLPASLLQP